MEKELGSKVCFFLLENISRIKIRNMFPNLKNQKTILIRKPIRIQELLIKIDGIIYEKAEI